jgi:hypothetical protein
LRVNEKRVLRKILEPRREEVKGGWGKLCKEFLNLYYSSYAIRVIKSLIMRWIGHVLRKREMRNSYKILVENLRERGYVGDRNCYEDNI